jgi:hypothetical protein
MNDEAFLRAVEEGAIAIRFGHREHLRMAWLRRGDEDRAVALFRGVAAAHGQPERYHETLTRFWLALVRRADELVAPASFDDLLSGHPQLAEKELPLRHYSRESLFSDRARREFVEPDLVSLPSGGV